MDRSPGRSQLGQTGKSRRRDGHNVEPMSLDAGPAMAALDRIQIPQDIVDRISEIISPRSSLIISDEGMSPETGKDTDFVILLNSEPQGAIKMRRHDPEAHYRYDRQYHDRTYRRSPTYAPSGRAFGELLGVCTIDVAFHVLVRPAARVSDIRKLREDESQFGEETEHLACHRRRCPARQR